MKRRFHESKELRTANISLNEFVEDYLKAFDMSSKILQLQYNSFIDTSVKATIQIFHDVGPFDRFENKDEIFKDYIIFNTNPKKKN